MAFCVNCGNQLQDGVKFCDSCGTPQGAMPVRSAAPVYQQVQPQQVRRYSRQHRCRHFRQI